MRVVAALGGNALLRRGEPLDADTQRRNAHAAAQALAPIARGHELIVTHGNGPQVGLLALQAAAVADQTGAPPTPLDVLDAESEGMIGYVVEQQLAQILGDDRVATLLTRTLVDTDDPAFDTPTKPIGPTYDEETARRLAEQHGWSIARDGDDWRRVVASPPPVGVVGRRAIGLLVEAGLVVVCAGGGGIPVTRTDHRSVGVEAVVDKDLTAALLAEELDADVLLLLTDVPGIIRDHETRSVSVIRHASPRELEALELPAGSMGPKAQACARFVRRTGGRAAIGSLRAAGSLLAGRSGTQVVPVPGSAAA